MDKQKTNPDELLNFQPLVDDHAALRQMVYNKMADAMTPGYEVEFDPDEAEFAGAFAEDAMSEADAAESSADMVDLDMEPTFLRDEGPRGDIPTFITTERAGGLEQAAMRKELEG